MSTNKKIRDETGLKFNLIKIMLSTNRDEQINLSPGKSIAL
jgi:hypothetical protein